MTRAEILKNAINSFKANQALEIENAIKVGIQNEINPKIAENNETYNKTVEAMKKQLLESNQKLIDDYKQLVTKTITLKYEDDIAKLNAMAEE